MNIIGRVHWNTRHNKFVAQDPQDIRTLVVHHTVSKAPVTYIGARAEMRNLQRMHMDSNGWSDIGYNLVIDRWGRVWEGRGIRRVGAHTKGYNTNTVGVAFMGNYETSKLNERQIRAFNEVKAKLRAHGCRIERIKGHRQMPGQSTACPGKHVMAQLSLGDA